METTINKSKNQVNVLYPYRTKGGIWCFDDKDLEIVAEPFVGEINDIIDYFAKGRENLAVYISKGILPNETLVLNKKEELGQGMYECTTIGVTGWLCPCLLNYFPDYVDEIHVRIEK